MPEERILCCECDAPATWVRHTQFAGNHPYCTVCAEKESDFGKEDSYSYWDKLPTEVIAPKHPTEVPGYDGRLDELVRHILSMRYDRVEEFYRLSAEEIQRQAKCDAAKNHPQVVGLLEEAAWNEARQRRLFSSVWRLCEPYMHEEEKKE